MVLQNSWATFQPSPLIGSRLEAPFLSDSVNPTIKDWGIPIIANALTFYYSVSTARNDWVIRIWAKALLFFCPVTPGLKAGVIINFPCPLGQGNNNYPSIEFVQLNIKESRHKGHCNNNDPSIYAGDSK